MLMILPQELLRLVFEQLSKADLWTIYNVSSELRNCVARPLFSETELRLESFLPYEINGRMLPARRIFQILKDRSFNIRELLIIPSNEIIRPDIWELIGKMPSLTLCCISGDGWDWNGDYHSVGNPPVSVMSQLVELRELESMVSTGWQSCSPFESLRYLEIRQLSDGLLKIPAARAVQELTVSFDPEERREPCDILLNLSQLPRLTTLRICHLLEGGLTVTGKSRSVKHLELVDSSIDGDEVFPRLSSSLESIRTEGASMRGDLERGMRFPCLRFVEVEGNLSLLPLILFSSTASLKLFIVHYDHEWDWNGLEKILNEFPPGGMPPLNCIVDVSRTVTLSDHDGSLALFLKLGRNVYARYVDQYCSGW
ncbi:hypothetical protein CNMCM5793_007504 [Aspergillus hiratsukae]|uniref:F-box domain-containing protein n=1 Tax=Aspergillus hiratsukae TaxID=1194566 RepID=A0A8H6V169_9EURO|nr:hypothetical protein CNMCM5793_007504 [Aspergillus hiratsukae]KAF7174237.1 hypothetical protein CNMCM6106_008365 [Aspergillus hiratsukae]